ncbi:MAG: hypothetical protein JWM33_3634 [Caulobacteraceae bacterium]|nr:hypothetical protein [Caulobacteraceae bacterium]
MSVAFRKEHRPLPISAPPIAPDHWMEQAYWVSQMVGGALQLVLVAVAALAAWAAFQQVSTFKLFELLKYAQGEDFRQARRIVIRDLEPIKGTDWWNDVVFEAGASDCCAHYDTLGRVLMFGRETRLARVLDPWGPSIIRTHEILLPFIELGRSTAGPDFRGYEWLYKKAIDRRDAARRKARS